MKLRTGLRFKASEKGNPMNFQDLAIKECRACKVAKEPLKGPGLDELQKALGRGWSLIGQHHLEKLYTFKNFAEALKFTNKIGELAEAQDHHPDIYLAWGKVKITLWSHSVDGLTESDFVLAAKIEGLN